MKTKILLSMAIITILPFGAWADWTLETVEGPTQVLENGTVVRAEDGGPYEIAEISAADATQVVSASYVKGAYNDIMAAVNYLFLDKQGMVANVTDSQGSMELGALGTTGIISALANKNLSASRGERSFVSASGVVNGILSQRVTAVDTWGSTHTVDLGLKTAQ